ncbi:MAG: poly-beta-1,6-N-acetyl-D-glucosamine N-deacetylase PgaB [Burkholderiales bacterium]
MTTLHGMLVATLLSLCCLAAPVSAAKIEHPPGSLIILCYHDVVDDVRDHDDRYSVDLHRFAEQLSWLKEAGYVPVSLSDVLAARAGRKPLPAKPVLLTFDDGHRSVYTHVFPLLRLFKYPAVIALVGKWMDGKPGEMLSYADRPTPREHFLAWGEVREMVASGLIEVASHSYNLHQGVIANPQGNTIPAAVARVFDTATGRYESDGVYLARIERDLALSANLIARETGTRPRAMVWPFGAYSMGTAWIAESLGMEIGLTLDDGVNRTDQSLATLKRILVGHNPNLPNFISELLAPQPTPRRVMRVDLEDVLDANVQAQEEKLSRLLDRIDSLKPNVVYLQAFADTNGDGLADALYFPNRSLPMRADLYSRVARQIQTRIEIDVYAWMPVNAFAIGDDDNRAQRITEIYQDLGRHGPLDGVLFQDPIAFNRPPANSRERIEELAATVARFSAPLKFAVAPGPDTIDEWMGRAVHAAQATTSGHWLDHVTIRETMAGNVASGKSGVRERISKLRETNPEAATRVVIELEAVPAKPASDKSIDEASSRIATRMRELELAGILSFGYAPDRPASDFPRLQIVKPAMSLRAFPLR